MVDFGSKIRDLRIGLGLTQKELASNLNISISTLSHWECNYQEPSFKDLKNLCLFFSVTSDYLLELEDDFGVKVTEKNAPRFNTEEQELIENYRALSVSGKQLIKTTIETFLESNEKQQSKIN